MPVLKSLPNYWRDLVDFWSKSIFWKLILLCVNEEDSNCKQNICVGLKRKRIKHFSMVKWPWTPYSWHMVGRTMSSAALMVTLLNPSRFPFSLPFSICSSFQICGALRESCQNPYSHPAAPSHLKQSSSLPQKSCLPSSSLAVLPVFRVQICSNNESIKGT